MRHGQGAGGIVQSSALATGSGLLPSSGQGTHAVEAAAPTRARRRSPTWSCRISWQQLPAVEKRTAISLFVDVATAFACMARRLVLPVAASDEAWMATVCAAGFTGEETRWAEFSFKYERAWPESFHKPVPIL